MRSFLRNYRVSVPVISVVLVGLGWLAFGFFGIHTLFIDDKVDEAVPEFDEPAVVGQPPVVSADPATSTPPTTVATAAPAGEVVTEYIGEFRDQAHPTSGQAVVLGNGSGQRFVRFENFQTDNGPDLNVYLVNSAAGEANDFVDLGDLKGNVGDQNYEIPEGVDLEVYDTVVVWCVRFSVNFGDAPLTAA